MAQEHNTLTVAENENCKRDSSRGLLELHPRRRARHNSRLDFVSVCGAGGKFLRKVERHEVYGKGLWWGGQETAKLQTCSGRRARAEPCRGTRGSACGSIQHTSMHLPTSTSTSTSMSMSMSMSMCHAHADAHVGAGVSIGSRVQRVLLHVCAVWPQREGIAHRVY